MKNKINKTVTQGVVKVPVIMQLEMTECGAASLAMMMAYFGTWLPLERTRQDCGVSRDGSNARNILRAARSYGMEAHAYQVDIESIKEEGPFPCIIHWGFNHFLVLDGFKGNKAYLNDPARGAIAVPMEEFDKNYTGICITIEPGEDYVPSGQKKSVLDFAKSRLSGTGKAVTFVVITTMLASLISILSPAFSRIFLDRLLTGKNPEWIVPFFGVLTAFSILQVIVSLISTYYSIRIEGKMASLGNASYLWQVLHLPMQFFGQRIPADIAQRKKMNANIAMVLIHTIAPLALNMIMMVFYLVVMVRYSPMLTCVGLVSIFINMFMSKYISDKRINITRVQMRDSGKLQGSTVSGISMVETLKASGAEDAYFEKWAGIQASVNASQVKFEKVNQYLGLIPALASALTGSAVLGLGVWLVIQGEFEVGMVMAFQGFMTAFLNPATALIQAGQSIQEMTTQMERLDDVMNYPQDQVFDYQDPENYSKLSGHLEMKNVTFGYSKLAPPLIENFSLTLEPGKKVAFVGTSGCGKSTLAKLISGLYQPWSGEILFDGKPMSEIDHNVFTGSVAVVDQEISMFEDSIANNIKMWDKNIMDFEMILAARDAQIHDDIMLRKGGYKHVLQEGGKDFSGGQRQRMEIARALAQDPTLLILDEATSALDAKTEFEAIQSITDRGLTCVIVAHRLSTIRDCDEIIVLSRGQVVERGTHEELFALDGFYTSLVSNE